LEGEEHYIQAHVDSCLGVQEVELPRKAIQATTSPFRARSSCVFVDDAGLLSDMDRKWAETKIDEFSGRYRLTPLDASVALASLCLCKTSAEMRDEATSLISDNAPVRNFAADLWRRFQGGK
jgi:hypothetical protein